MQIQYIRFKNLNSLAGEWGIDFTHADYAVSGLFAITGPTGAGKTTILDAICLALYGRTPRLKTISNSVNEIMTRHTGECFAEVTFQTAKGHFRCHWSQHRSRKKPGGKLQQARHEIIDDRTDTVLETKLKKVAETVESVTGLDFHRFTRSILLAQGGFAAFLKASPDERAPILEQITGTDIYSQISISVHQRNRNEHDKLTELQAELNGVQLLDGEEEADLHREWEAKHQAAKRLSAELKKLNSALAWQERMERLILELDQVAQQRAALEKRMATAAPDLMRLERARKTLSLEPAFVRIDELRRQQKADLSELKDIQHQLPEAQKNLESSRVDHHKAETALLAARECLNSEAIIIRGVRTLDIQIKETDKQLVEQNREQKSLSKERGAVGTDLDTTTKDATHIAAALKETNQYLAENQKDIDLISTLDTIQHQLMVYSNLATKTLDYQDRSNQAQIDATAAQTALQAKNADLKNVQTKAEAASAAMDTLNSQIAALLQGRDLAAWRDELEGLTHQENQLQRALEISTQITGMVQRRCILDQSLVERQHQLKELAKQEARITNEKELQKQITDDKAEKLKLLIRISKLEDDRARLQDGVPCPLCGAPDHPYAVGNVPAPDSAELELRTAQKRLDEVETTLRDLTAERTRAETERGQAQKELGDLKQQHNDSCKVLETMLTPIGIPIQAAEKTPQVIESELERCRLKRQTCRTTVQKADALEQSIRKARQKQERTRQDLGQQEKAQQKALHTKDSTQKESRRLALEAAALSAEQDRALGQVLAVVIPFGIHTLAPQETEKVLAQLTCRKQSIEKRLTKKERLDQQAIDLKHKTQMHKIKLADLGQQVQRIQEKIGQQTLQRNKLIAKRWEQFGDKDPDTEEKALALTLTEAETLRDRSLSSVNGLNAALGGIKDQILSLEKRTIQRKAPLDEAEASFNQQVQTTGFANEADFLEARLPGPELDSLTARKAELDRQASELNTRQTDKTAALEAEKAKQLSEHAFQALKETMASMNKDLAELQNRLGAIDERLKEQARRLGRQKEKQHAVKTQKQECLRWEKLHELIGSADGKKFRNFAQGLTFELMVGHANRQLQKMTDRYIMIRDETKPLELNVIDDYQAGEIRSTENLSGGESFIVSLALALGLSSMASRNVNIDSLFLDEGFGSLDEETLETALTTLAGLHQEGKLIGVISHVPALKERIPIQIQVHANTGGRSHISGPGCSRLS